MAEHDTDVAGDDRGPRHETYLEVLGEPSEVSARRILPMISAVIEVGSVVDIGCGPGTWLKVARELGTERVLGVDGEWAREWITDARMEFTTHDLESPLPDLGRFDLALLLGVAEFLDAARAQELVGEVCTLAPAILFSSAIPGQGLNAGLQRTREWPSWWAEWYERHGFRPVDLVRPQIWSDVTLPWWYRQGAILYVHESLLQDVTEKAGVRSNPAFIDLVHPEPWLSAITRRQRPIGTKERAKIALGLPAALGKSLAGRARRSRPA